MARLKIVMPQMGESITTGTITKWNKSAGEIIELDEILLEISTDKVESEIPSPYKGRVETLLFKEGDTVDVGVTIAELEDDLSVPFSGGGSPSSEQPKATDSSPAPAQSPTPASAEPHVAPAAASGSKRFYTPLVRSLANKHNIPLTELDNLEGSGLGGRVNKKDFEQYLSNRKSGAQISTAPASPSMQSTSIPTPPKATVAAYSPTDRVEIEPMDNMRKTIARNMINSKLTSPHVNSLSEVDLTHLVQFRNEFKEQFFKREGIKLTFGPFIAYAIVQALKDFPRINASVDGDNLIIKKDINLGVAVAVPGNGLIVPVIHQADNLNMTGICRAMNDLASKARSKSLTLDHLKGGTFTFTNVGSFGTLLATPIILQPQIGIYAAGAIKKRPVVVETPGGDSIAVRSMMYGTHTYDHRVVDGEQGGKFLEAVHYHLREMKPETLF